MADVQKFKLGKVVATRGAHEAIGKAEVLVALVRHSGGDWGLVGKEDWKANEDALIDDRRIFSKYKSRNGTTFWIITEADRSVTTVLLPDEY